MKTIQDANKAITFLKSFIYADQLSAIKSNFKREEGQFFIDKVCTLADQIQNMPKTYETDGQGDQAIAQLHYFKGSADWYITEKDQESEQLQAFGLANLGYGSELGYISIIEVLGVGAELDLYFTPLTLAQIKEQ